MVSYWPFNNDSFDYFGNSPLTSIQNTAYTIDRNNCSNACTTLSSGYYSAPTGVYFSGDFTIMLWFMLNNATPVGGNILDFGSPSTGVDNIIFTYFVPTQTSLPFPALGCITNGAGSAPTYYASNKYFSTNKWYHLTFTLAGNLVSFYVNANLIFNMTVQSGYTVFFQKKI